MVRSYFGEGAGTDSQLVGEGAASFWTWGVLLRLVLGATGGVWVFATAMDLRPAMDVCGQNGRVFPKS